MILVIVFCYGSYHCDLVINPVPIASKYKLLPMFECYVPACYFCLATPQVNNASSSPGHGQLNYGQHNLVMLIEVQQPNGWFSKWWDNVYILIWGALLIIACTLGKEVNKHVQIIPEINKRCISDYTNLWIEWQLWIQNAILKFNNKYTPEFN